MGSYAMHLCVSDAVKKKLKLSNDYLLGSILPDVIKTKTGDRNSTHYIKEVIVNGDIRELPDIKQAIKSVKYDNKEITLGYISHLIEDYIWFDEYIPSYARKIDDDKIMYLFDNSIHNDKEFSKHIYNDYYNVNRYLVEKHNLNINEIKNDIGKLLGKEEYDIFCKNLLYEESKEISNNMFLTKESIDSYISKTVIEVEKVIKELLKG